MDLCNSIIIWSKVTSLAGATGTRPDVAFWNSIIRRIWSKVTSLAGATGTRPDRAQRGRPWSGSPEGLPACAPAPSSAARRSHQLFPAAAAPIAGRPAAPNINDTQDRGLEAQARGPTPTPAAPATSTQHFSILRGTSGSGLEAETGSRKRPFAPLRLAAVPVEQS